MEIIMFSRNFIAPIWTLLVISLLQALSLIAQPNVRKKGYYNPAMSDGRINTEGNKTYIKGKVLDRLSNEPLIGATVKLNPRGMISYTDLNGYFEFLNLPPDTFSIEVNYIGYKKTIFPNINTTEKQLITLVLTVEIQVSEMEGVLIESEVPRLSEFSAILLQKNSNFISENQSGNQLEKENFDYSVSTGFQRMKGASVVADNTFIRGLPERYNAVLLNNAPLISLNPQQNFYRLRDIPSRIITNVQILKSSTSEFYSNYGGGLIHLETEKMPDAPKLKFQFNGFYHSLATFQRLNSLPFNSRYLLISETQNIPIKMRNIGSPENPVIPNYFRNRQYGCVPSTQWSAYYGNRLSVLNNRELGIVASVNFWDNYERIQVSGSDVQFVNRDSLKSQSIRNGFQDKHTQNLTAIANGSLKWNNKNFLYSQNTFTYKNENQVYSQPTDSNFFRAQSFQRNVLFAQQNSGEHSLVAKKDRSLRLEWSQFYHFYYQQTPASVSMNFDHNNFLKLPNPNSTALENSYQKNLIYTDKQRVHQVGGDLFFDVMVKEDDNKAKTRIGTFLNYTNTRFNSRNFHYPPNATVLDSSVLSMNQIFSKGINLGENIFELIELTDSSHSFSAQHINVAPYLNIQYELTDIFHFVVGFREDFSIRRLYNGNNSLLISQDFQSDLPSLSMIFKASEKSQWRLNYMLSVSRPTDRDLLGARYFHPVTQILQLASPNLLPSTINNFDARFESFFNTDIFSLNLFFKRIHLPIENLYSTPSSSVLVLTTAASNANAALLGGGEIEWKQNLGNLIDEHFFEKLMVYVNGYASFSNTKVRSTDKFFSSSTRPLQGQSNYGFNFGMNWTKENWGLKILSFVNHKGKSIFLVNSSERLNIWELQRTDWSVQVSKTYRSNWEFRLAFFNLLDQPIRWAYLSKNQYFTNDVRQIFRTQKLGRQFLISVNFRM